MPIKNYFTLEHKTNLQHQFKNTERSRANFDNIIT